MGDDGKGHDHATPRYSCEGIFGLAVSGSSSRLIERQTLTGATARALREKILSGEIREGEQLRQDALANEYGVSRIPVREALRQLEAEGLVSFFPHRGAVVSTLSLAEIEELFEIRALIEPDVLRRAIPQLTEEDLARAEQLLDLASESYETGKDIAHWGELNWKFHSSLCAPADRPRSMAVIERLNINIDRFLRIHLVLTNGTARANDDHRKILAACRKGQVHRAVNLLEEHILSAGRDLVDCIQRQRALAAGRSRLSVVSTRS